MTNEELAVKIQQGEQELMPVLWEQVERFVQFSARKRLARRSDRAGIELGDLISAGYIGTVKAVELFNAEQGTFLNILSMTLKTAFAEAGGYRSLRQQRDPLHTAASLDELLPGTDALFLSDTVPDPGAEQDFEDAENKIYLEQLHNALEGALSTLESNQENVIRQRFYNNMTLTAIAKEEGISIEAVRTREGKAFSNLRKPKVGRKLQEYIERRTPYYLHVGLCWFNNTRTSSVEEVVFKRESWRERENETDRILESTNREIERMLEEMPWLKENVEQLRSNI